jgi:hypothetical protein
VAIALLYWFADGIAHFYVYERENFVEVLLPSNKYVLWSRLPMVCIIIVFGILTQIVVNKLYESSNRYQALFNETPNAILLAHELTQPLTVVHLSIENALDELDKITCPETVNNKLLRSTGELSNIKAIIDRFRNFARRFAEPSVSEVYLQDIGKQIIDLLSRVTIAEDRAMGFCC